MPWSRCSRSIRIVSRPNAALARMSAVEAAPAAPAAATNGQQRDHDLPLPAMATRRHSRTRNRSTSGSVRAPDGGAAPAAFAPGEYAEATRTAPGLRSADIAPAQAARDLRWPIYLVIGVSALVVLIAAILIRGSEFTAALRPAPTAALPVLGATAQAGAPALDTTARTGERVRERARERRSYIACPAP